MSLDIFLAAVFFFRIPLDSVFAIIEVACFSLAGIASVSLLSIA